MQELDMDGLALDIIDDVGAWDRSIELEMVVEETAPDWEGLVEDERLEEEGWIVMGSLVELF
jgi:hypothetical protein